MSVQKGSSKVVWGAIMRPDKTFWTRVGHAWEGREGTIFAQIQSCPTSGWLCIKDSPKSADEEAASMYEEAAQ